MEKQVWESTLIAFPPDSPGWPTSCEGASTSCSYCNNPLINLVGLVSVNMVPPLWCISFIIHLRRSLYISSLSLCLLSLVKYSYKEPQSHTKDSACLLTYDTEMLFPVRWKKAHYPTRGSLELPAKLGPHYLMRGMLKVMHTSP